MTTATHALHRTSPKGGPFIGTCYRCGMTGLSSGAALEPCANTAGMSNDEAVLEAMSDPTETSIIFEDLNKRLTWIVKAPIDLVFMPSCRKSSSISCGRSKQKFMSPKFRGATGRVWTLLRRGHDVPIDKLFTAAYPAIYVFESRVQQQVIGRIVSYINTKLEGQKIGPGVKRRTYRLRQL